MKKNRICKICRNELAPAILYLHLCEGYSYKRIIEAYGRFIPNLNFYNMSNHLNFHISEKDIREAEESKAHWEKYKAKLLAREATA